MSNKQTHIVSPELNMGAQFKAIDHIPTNHLQAGDVIQVLPGSYADPRTTNVADVTIMGMGDAKDIVFAGFSIPSGITAGSNVIVKNCKIDSPGAIVGNAAVTVTFENCIFDGTVGNARSAALAIANAGITTGVLDSNAGVVADDAASVIIAERCTFGDNVLPGYGVVAHNNSGSQTYRYCNFPVDTGMLSNVATVIEHCTFTGANSYFTSIAAGGTPTVTVRSSVAAAANAGNHTETVVAAIS